MDHQPLHSTREGAPAACPTHGLFTLQGVCPPCAHENAKQRLGTHIELAAWALDCAIATLEGFRIDLIAHRDSTGHWEPHGPVADIWKPGPSQAEGERLRELVVNHLEAWLQIATEEAATAWVHEGDRLTRFASRQYRLGWTLAAVGWTVALVSSYLDPTAGVVMGGVLLAAIGAVGALFYAGARRRDW